VSRPATGGSTGCSLSWRLAAGGTGSRWEGGHPGGDLSPPGRAQLGQDVLDVGGDRLGARNSSAAIWRLVLPAATSRATSNSRAVSGDQGAAGRPPATAASSRSASATTARAVTSPRRGRGPRRPGRPPRRPAGPSGRSGPGPAGPRCPPRTGAAAPTRRRPGQGTPWRPAGRPWPAPAALGHGRRRLACPGWNGPPAPRRPRPAGGGVGDGGQQAGLADPGLAGHEQQVPLAACGRAQAPVGQGEEVVAAHQDRRLEHAMTGQPRHPNRSPDRCRAARPARRWQPNHVPKGV
jgi:hypothetical protein